MSLTNCGKLNIFLTMLRTNNILFILSVLLHAKGDSKVLEPNLKI